MKRIHLQVRHFGGAHLKSQCKLLFRVITLRPLTAFASTRTGGPVPTAKP